MCCLKGVFYGTFETHGHRTALIACYDPVNDRQWRTLKELEKGPAFLARSYEKMLLYMRPDYSDYCTFARRCSSFASPGFERRHSEQMNRLRQENNRVLDDLVRGDRLWDERACQREEQLPKRFYDPHGYQSWEDALHPGFVEVPSRQAQEEKKREGQAARKDRHTSYGGHGRRASLLNQEGSQPHYRLRSAQDPTATAQSTDPAPDERYLEIQRLDQERRRALAPSSPRTRGQSRGRQGHTAEHFRSNSANRIVAGGDQRREEKSEIPQPRHPSIDTRTGWPSPTPRATLHAIPD